MATTQATTQIAEVGTDRWNARMHSSLALASELVAELDSPSRAAREAGPRRRINQLLAKLNRSLLEMIAGVEPLVLSGLSTLPPAADTLESIRAVRGNFIEAYQTCNRILALDDRAWANRIQLKQLSSHAEKLMNLIDWMDAVNDGEEIQSRFDQALSDLAAGDVVSWSTVQ